MSIADILDKAADLIEPRGHWIKGDFAEDANGVRWDEVDGDYEALATYKPVAFCMLGAVAVSAGRDPDDAPKEAIRTIAAVLRNRDIPHFNDAKRRRKCEVIAKLREAAALSRQHEESESE